MRRWQVASSPASLFPAPMRSLPLKVYTTRCETWLEEQEGSKCLSRGSWERWVPGPGAWASRKSRTLRVGRGPGTGEPRRGQLRVGGDSPGPCDAPGTWGASDAGPEGGRAARWAVKGWACASAGCGQQQFWHRQLAIASHLLFLGNFLSTVFATGLWKFMTQWGISPRPSCPWLSGCLEKLVFLPLSARLSCLWIPKLLFSPCSSLLPSRFHFPPWWKRYGNGSARTMRWSLGLS